MKGDKRQLYIALTEEIHTTLCGVCRYAVWESCGCCDGYAVCNHAIESKAEAMEEGLEPGQDCWGYSPRYPLDTLVELVSAVLSQGYHEWGVVGYSRTEITVYGRYPNEENKELSSKVRIGHNGKSNDHPDIAMIGKEGN